MKAIGQFIGISALAFAGIIVTAMVVAINDPKGDEGPFFIIGVGGLPALLLATYLSSRAKRREKERRLADARQRAQDSVPPAPTSGGVQCPECLSNQTTFTNQRFGVGKAAVGVVLTGGIGLLAGGIGRNKIIITCLNCGHQWRVGGGVA
jgi:hypothetical protein